MKRVWLFILSTALVLGTVFALCACGKQGTDSTTATTAEPATTETPATTVKPATTEAPTTTAKPATSDPNAAALPKTAYEKVAYAFNGVEKSFASKEGGSAAFGDYAVRRLLAAENDPLARIRAIYEAGDDQGDVIDGLEYTQPPMIQFRCLKSVLDKTGESFAFDTKYYDEVTGTVFVDPATGYSMADDENKDGFKYDYLFRLGLKISIDQNDRIKADVSFTIRLTRGEENYETNWYVGMVLDYDMTSETPDYTLAMYTANDEGALPYIGLGNVYEYDFVNVDENKIKEWRKFVMETDVVLVKDDAHPTFASYRNDGVNFRADTCKWYYDGTLKKITRHDAEKDAALADLFFDFGLNATAIDGTPFLSDKGVVNDAIKTSYREFSEIFRMDVIYSLVCRRKDDQDGKGNQQNEVAGIGVFTQEGEAWTARTVERDATLAELLGTIEPWGQGIGITRPVLYTVDADGNRINPIGNLDDYDYSVYLGDAPEISFRAKFPLDELLSDTVANRLGGMETLEENGFLITVEVRGKNGDNTFTSFSLIVGFRSEIEEKDAKKFPAELIEIGVPEYETENGSFKTVEGKQDGYALEVRTNNDERTAYLKKLTDGGFVKNENNEYVKTVGENVLFITVSGFSGDVLTISVRTEKNSGQNESSWDGETIAGLLDGKFTLPEPTGAGTVTFKLNANDKNLYVYGLTDDEKAAYLNEIAAQDGVWVVGETYLTTRKIKFLYEACFYAIELNLDVGGALYFELNLERNGAQPAVGIVINGNDPIYLEPAANGGPGYVKTVKLTAGDVVSFVNNNGRPIEAPAFERNPDDPEGSVVTLQSGTYTVVYDAMIEIRK